jgi:hypothetical protein
LTDNPTVPPRIIVQVDQRICPSGSNSVDECVELSECIAREGGGVEVVIDYVLPSYGESEAAGGEVRGRRGRREMD